MVPRVPSHATFFALVAATLAMGCPDPSAGIQTNGEGAAVPPSGPGQPGADQGALSQGATQPNDARFQVKPGDGVLLSGTFDYTGTATGNFRLDFLAREENGPPKLVHTLELKGPGPWKVTAPKEFGGLYIVAFIDRGGDGPSADDPAGRTPEPVVIGSEPINDIVLAVTDQADLGELTPGGADGPPPPPPDMPQGAAGGPPPGGEGTPEGGPPPSMPTPEGGDPAAGPAPGGAPPPEGGGAAGATE